MRHIHAVRLNVRTFTEGGDSWARDGYAQKLDGCCTRSRVSLSAIHRIIDIVPGKHIARSHGMVGKNKY